MDGAEPRLLYISCLLYETHHIRVSHHFRRIGVIIHLDLSFFALRVKSLFRQRSLCKNKGWDHELWDPIEVFVRMPRVVGKPYVPSDSA